MHQVVLRRGEDFGWVAEVPSLPGCLAQGRTRKQALANVRDAIDARIEAAREEGVEAPDETFDAVVRAV